MLNEAAIGIARENRQKITMEDIEEASLKVKLGPSKRRLQDDYERRMTAYHEAGHAVVGHFLKNCDPVRKVSIIGRGMAGGYTLSMPEADVRYRTIAMFKDDMAMALGGYVAEKMIYGDDHLSTGPSSDLKTATQSAKAMVLRYGMSDKLGPRNYGENEEMIFLAQEIHEKKNYSEKTAELIDDEINGLIEEASRRAKEVLTKEKDKMNALVAKLLKTETVEQEEFNKIMNEG